MAKKNPVSIFEIQQWLQSRMQACPLCGHDAWDLEPEIFNLRLGKVGMVREFKNVNCAILTCTQCGNLYMIDVERVNRKALLGAAVPAAAVAAEEANDAD